MKKRIKSTTIETLASMVKRGFEHIILKQHAHQIAMLEKRLNRIENTLAIK